MQMKRFILVLFVVALNAVSCEKVFFEENLATTDAQKNFDYLWNEVDQKYSYFELKGIDWDAVKTEYSTQLYADMPQDSLFNVLGDMLTELEDDHVNLISNFNISFFGTEFLGQDNFYGRLIQENYLERDYYVSGPFAHDFLDNGEIGYVYFPSFQGTINSTNIDFIIERYKDTKGLILDLRENGGGAVTDIFSLLSRFVEERTLTHYSRIKNGPGRNDFSEAEPVFVTPYSGIRYTKPVIMLIDRGTYSAGSFTALATKALPNITLIGDTTGGGLGLPNGGQLPNGWTYRFSITQALTLDQRPDYENGVPPDIQVLFDWNDLTTDEVLERAILELQ
jgi:C-terminal processing protease CtpA/Prc